MSKQTKFKVGIDSRSISLTGLLSALYVILSFIPISPFIGGSSILTLNLVIVPVIAILLKPIYALISSLIGVTIMFFLVPVALANIFGVFVILMPTIGSFIGSLLYHYRERSLPIVVPFFLLSINTFLYKTHALFWIIPHLIATFLTVPFVFCKLNERVKILMSCFITTMSEQCVMMNLASWYLNLPYEVFLAAFPFMIYERLIATIGGFLITTSIFIFLKQVKLKVYG